MTRIGVSLSVVCYVSTTFVWTIGIFFREIFRSSGADFASSMQIRDDSNLVNFISVLAWSVSLFLPIFFSITIQTLGPSPGLKSLGAFAMSIYFSAIFRIIIGWPQLYWTNDSVRGLLCLDNWALPSSSLSPLSTVVFFFIWQLRDSLGFLNSLPIAFLIGQYFVECYLGFEDYFSALMSITFGASIAVTLHCLDDFFETVRQFMIDNCVKGTIYTNLAFLVSVGVIFAVYEGRKPDFQDNWKHRLDDVCSKADDVSVNASCFTAAVIIATYFGGIIGSVLATIVIKEPWWTNPKTRLVRILMTLAYIYLGFAIVFILAIVKQAVTNASDSEFVELVIVDRYGYFTFGYGLVTSYILGFTLTGVLPMLIHASFNGKKEALKNTKEKLEALIN